MIRLLSSHRRVAAVSLALSVGIHVVPATAASSTGALSIIVSVPFAIAFSPSAPSETCEAAAGTVVSNLTLAGGDAPSMRTQEAASWTLAGDTASFALGSSASGLTNTVVVGPNGIAAADCGKTDAVTVTANQP